MSSRMAQATPVSNVRPAAYARCMLSGQPGAGKTLTGLMLAEVLSGDRAVLGIDTEAGEMLLYRDRVPHAHLRWDPPYHPSQLGETIADADESVYGCVLVDSLSHFWRAEGGTLDLSDGKFGGWKTARPVQDGLVTTMHRARQHLVLAVRSKMEYAVEQEGDKQRVRRLGLAPVQDGDLEYEVNLGLDIDRDHRIEVTKSRFHEIEVGSLWTGFDETIKLAELYRDVLGNGDPLLTRSEFIDWTATFRELPDLQRKWALDQWTRRGLPTLKECHASHVPAMEKLLDEAQQVQAATTKGADR